MVQSELALTVLFFFLVLFFHLLVTLQRAKLMLQGILLVVIFVEMVATMISLVQI